MSVRVRAPALAVGVTLAFMAMGQMSDSKTTTTGPATTPTMVVQIGQTSDGFDLVLINASTNEDPGLRMAILDNAANGMGKEAVLATTSVAGAFSASFSARPRHHRLAATMNSRSTSSLLRADTGSRRIPLRV